MLHAASHERHEAGRGVGMQKIESDATMVTNAFGMPVAKQKPEA